MEISTHTPLAGRDDNAYKTPSTCVIISTHTPLAGRDQPRLYPKFAIFSISTHTPLAGRDQLRGLRVTGVRPFLLTRPLRGATRRSYSAPPRSISTHTPLAGRDETGDGINMTVADFYSHAPCGARRSEITALRMQTISTHTPLAGRDRAAAEPGQNQDEFLLTRPLRGATLAKTFGIVENENFYSHAPCGARQNNHIRLDCPVISTHTPLAGRDKYSDAELDEIINISTHTPLAGRDHFALVHHGRHVVFLLTRPLRGATQSLFRPTQLQRYFYSHAPCGARRYLRARR